MSVYPSGQLPVIDYCSVTLCVVLENKLSLVSLSLSLSLSLRLSHFLYSRHFGSIKSS